MDKLQRTTPNYLFETSWEVCNKVGGIHTVVATKAQTIVKKFGDNYITFGPDFNNASIEFEEDHSIYQMWKRIAYQNGIRIKIGRWKIKSSPIAVLVDFSSLVTDKDRCLSQMWEDYKVDSISGSWDYIEPVLFGYGVARAIECFVDTYCNKNDKIVAHFHEWMTASGGLYLKKYMPQVATLFTTHATVSGRCIAGNGLNLYEDLHNFNADEIANRFCVMAKHSIEKVAANEYDCFTTVSEITGEECECLLSKKPDIITPNGFEDDFVFPANVREEKRAIARQKMIKVAETLLNKTYESEPIIVGTSGRYEFRNKGLDEFIDSLALLNKNDSLEGDILAYIMVPGWNLGARKDLSSYLTDNQPFVMDKYAAQNTTHYLGDNSSDAIIGKLRDGGLLGNGEGKVSVIFVPAYLDSFDGIFNLHYYDMLPGFDITLFPSYYEPWGYTPLESIAFGVPSVTTTLSGFGRWVAKYANGTLGVEVIERDDNNDTEVKTAIVDILLKYSSLSSTEREELGTAAHKLSQTALWKHLTENYYKSYSFAIDKMNSRMENLFLDGGEVHEQVNYIKHQLTSNTPTWTRIIVERTIPAQLEKLEKLTKNLWWVWNAEARSLFDSIDNTLWIAVERNPIALIDNLTVDQLNALSSDEDFLARMDAVYEKFENYMAKKEGRKGNKISYFSMEYGLHSSLKIYSGGLGILAGDYLKEASDQNIPMVAVGLLYRFGYFTQRISGNGEQEASYEAQNFYKLPITPVRSEDGTWKTITLAYPGREVTARIWRCDVGRTELYLLDTDHDQNSDEDRSITYHLYGGDWENRLKQEVLLGIGGMKVVESLGFKADVYHCNEGHAALCSIQNIRSLIEREGLSFSEALEVVRASSLFTTHTPVPAGHDAFSEDMMRKYLSSMIDSLKITWEQFISLGRVQANNSDEKFSMSYLACNMSQEINGVSWLHGEVSKEILGGMWPNYFKSELNIGYVTNGVHFPTWAASSLQDIYTKAFGSSLTDYTYDKNTWQNIYDIPDAELWKARLHLKNKLTNHIIRRVQDPMRHRLGSPQEIVKIGESLKPNVLTIGFARRFATYKRAHLLFTDIERLDKIINNPERPVQFIFAGKAHPNDKPGQDLIKRIVEISSLPQFVGKIIFLQNYDMELARRMVQGVDVWMNTPTRPLEASGTSGEKAVMNGVLHFSVLDGWWVEGYEEGAGWMLPMERTYTDQHNQNLLDAEMIYTILEEQIVPAYYDQDENKVSAKWMSFIKKSISNVASNFTTKRMIDDYVERFYNKLAVRHGEVVDQNYAIARELAAWKRSTTKLWEDGVKILSSHTYDVSQSKIITGERYKNDVAIELNGLTPSDIGVELVVARQITQGNEIQIVNVIQLDLERFENNVAYYAAENTPSITGSYDIAIRVYANNKHLQNRMAFALVKWC